ncbi:hypothetical protein H0H93_003002, partial [Arthromyces matolae]
LEMTPKEREILHLVGAELLTQFTQEVSIAMLCGGAYIHANVDLVSLLINQEQRGSALSLLDNNGNRNFGTVNNAHSCAFRGTGILFLDEILRH